MPVFSGVFYDFLISPLRGFFSFVEWSFIGLRPMFLSAPLRGLRKSECAAFFWVFYLKMSRWTRIFLVFLILACATSWLFFIRWVEFRRISSYLFDAKYIGEKIQELYSLNKMEHLKHDPLFNQTNSRSIVKNF